MSRKRHTTRRTRSARRRGASAPKCPGHDDAASLSGNNGDALPPAGAEHETEQSGVEWLRSQLQGNVRLHRLLYELETYQEQVRRQTEQLIESQLSLEEVRDRYIELYDFAPVGYVTISAAGIIRELNLTGSMLLAIERERVVDLPLMGFIAEPDLRAYLGHLSECRRLARASTELRLRPRLGPWLPVQLTSRMAARMPGHEPSIRTAIVDLTEFKHKEAELESYRNRLRSMSAELTVTEERERLRIATALHDNIGQVLALAKIKLGILTKSCGPNPLLQQVQDLVGQAIQQTRSLTTELSPPVLHSLGLEAAIEWLADHNRAHDLEIEFIKASAMPRLGDDLKILLFQAVRELLNNVIKHAGAGHIRVTSSATREAVTLMVEDDGKGFSNPSVDARLAQTDGFGLFSIRTRLEHLGGRMDIDSHASRGTRVTLWVPARPLAEGGNRTDGSDRSSVDF